MEKKLFIIVQVPEATRYYINDIGCLRYTNGPNDGPVMSTIDTYLGDYEIGKVSNGQLTLVLKKQI